MAIPSGVMVWDITAPRQNIYLTADELGNLIRWLNKNRHGFIEDELKK
jgi:hypothetical protein